MSFDAKTAILSAIAKTDDANMKTVLLLLLGVLEEIGGKIDSFTANEDALRQTVLNGHEPVHHKHHEWLSDRIARDDDVRVMASWVKVQMQQEVESKQSQRKVRDDVLAKIIGAAAVALLGFIAGSAGIFK